MTTEAITLATIALYFALLLVVSKLTGKDSSNDSFFRAGRKSPWYLVAFGMIGTSISGVSLVSVPGYVGVTQMTYIQMCMGFFIGYLVIAFVLMPLYYKYGLTSIYGYLAQRFGNATHKTGASFFLLSKLSGACARFFLVCLILHKMVFEFLGFDFVITVSFMLSLLWLYTRRAGIKTLVYTDSLQTLSMLLAVIAMVWLIASKMGLGFKELTETISQSPYSRCFIFDDSLSRQAFWKQFIGGIFTAIVMTGLDQDMMQKNLTCPTLKDAQKDICCYGICFLPVNFLFLLLGVLLYTFAINQGLPLPEQTDTLLPNLVQGGYFGPVVTILFVLGITAAAFSSVDSALAALTTSFCIDIVNIEHRNWLPVQQSKFRKRVHLSIVLIFILFTLIFKAISNTSVIDAIYTMASYTYGPLLGLFAFGIFTRRHLPSDKFVPVICVLAPVICWISSILVPKYTGYHFSYELLVLNGLLTFLFLLPLSRRNSVRQ